MNLYETIKNGTEVFSYPFKQLDDEDYYDCVFRIYKAYQSALELMDASDISLLNESLKSLPDYGTIPLKREMNVINDSKEVWMMVTNSIRLLLSGRPAEAFEIVDKFFRADDGHFVRLFPVAVISGQLKLYRVRRSECAEQKKLFHIPFEERYKVSSMRYSIPGYPMLYMSGSLATAYTEIFPDKGLHEFTYARFSNKTDLYLWDMCFPDPDSSPFEFYRFFVFFPLFLACAIDVWHENGAYKPEYALPQLFTQFIKSFRYPLAPNGRLDGICYLPPVLENGASIDSLDVKNYAFVVDGASLPKGYDTHLAEKFLMTNPKRFGKKEFSNITNYLTNYLSNYIDRRDQSEILKDIDLK